MVAVPTGRAVVEAFVAAMHRYGVPCEVPPSWVVGPAGHQQVWLGPAFADRTVTVWADLTSVRVILDGQHVKTVGSRLSEQHLRQLRQRDVRPAGPELALPALPQRGGRHRLPPNVAIDVDRTVGPDGLVRLAGANHKVHPNLAGQRIPYAWTAISRTPSPTTP